jgi:colanic acid/amylovoran biosynthesis protein
MHSNILAATQGTPFVAISYEHKTEGIAKQIDMKKFCIAYEQVDKDKLYTLLISAYKNRKYLKNKLLHSLKTIRDEETQKWSDFLSA